MSTRRSSRLKNREEKRKVEVELRRKRRYSGILRKRKVVLADSSGDNHGRHSEEDGGDTSVLIVTPDRKVAPQRPNNFMRV